MQNDSCPLCMYPHVSPDLMFIFLKMDNVAHSCTSNIIFECGLAPKKCFSSFCAFCLPVTFKMHLYTNVSYLYTFVLELCTCIRDERRVENNTLTWHLPKNTSCAKTVIKTASSPSDSQHLSGFVAKLWWRIPRSKCRCLSIVFTVPLLCFWK